MAGEARQTRRNLAERIGADLRARVMSGELKAGDRLPTEHELVRHHGVSRTVVREALAGLRADGLVVARQGSGVFVAERKPQQTLSLLTLDLRQISSIIETLEVRAALESEAASLAAERRSPAELAKIRECHVAMCAAIDAGEQAERQDHAFHLAIAESTHNTHFAEFFSLLGARTIPRAQTGDRAATRDYLAHIRDEHARIVDAITRGDATAAHDTMRAHLKESQGRYQQLVEAAAGQTYLSDKY
ncbi:MAG: FadR/GntR family transcriptional regulator [Acuticoccus sp.]